MKSHLVGILLIFGGLGLVLGKSASQNEQVKYDGFAMPVAGMNEQDYTGIPTCPKLKNFTYSTVWAGDYHCGGERSGRHPGVDIPMPKRTEILAVCDGLVARSEYDQSFGWGNVIVAEHTVPFEGKVYSCYAHLDERKVVVGDTVLRGQLIGYSGNTGAVLGKTGNHLHFQIDKDEGGLHPYWFGSPNLGYIPDIEQKTHNPIPFTRGHTVFSSHAIVKPITDIELGRQYTGTIEWPNIALYTLPGLAGNSYEMNVRGIDGDPNFLLAYRNGVQYTANFYLDEFLIVPVERGGISSIILWSATNQSQYDLQVSSRPTVKDEQARFNAVLPKTQSLNDRLAYLELEKYQIGMIGNPNIALFALPVRRGSDYIVTNEFNQGDGKLIALARHEVTWVYGEHRQSIGITGLEDGVVPIIIDPSFNNTAFFRVIAQEIGDITPPYITGCTRLSNKTIAISFSEQLHNDGVWDIRNYEVKSSVRSVPIKHIVYISDRHEVNIELLKKIKPGFFGKSILVVSNLRDLAGNYIPIDPTKNSCQF